MSCGFFQNRAGSRLWRGLLWVRGGGGKVARPCQNLRPMKASISYPGFQRLAQAPLEASHGGPMRSPSSPVLGAERPSYRGGPRDACVEFYARVDRSLEELPRNGRRHAVRRPVEYARRSGSPKGFSNTRAYGSDEEVYSLTSASADAVRFVDRHGQAPRGGDGIPLATRDHRARRT